MLPIGANYAPPLLGCSPAKLECSLVPRPQQRIVAQPMSLLLQMQQTELVCWTEIEKCLKCLLQVARWGKVRAFCGEHEPPPLGNK